MYAEPETELHAELSAPTMRIGVPSAPRLAVQGFITPPRLTAIPAPTRASRVIAELRFPGDLVQARAQEMTHDARSAGARHTLKLWRECCQQALIALARIATALPSDAMCESLSWQLDGEDYLVSVVLVRPARPVIH